MISFPRYVVKEKNGITLLLAVILSAAFFSIALGVFHILFGQIVIMGQARESFSALNAADLGMERTLYRDRRKNECGDPLIDCSTGGMPMYLPPDDNNKACYVVDIGLAPSCPNGLSRCIKVTGQYPCAKPITDSVHYVKRKFELNY